MKKSTAPHQFPIYPLMTNQIAVDYERILSHEAKLSGQKWQRLMFPREVWSICCYLNEIAKSSHVIRTSGTAEYHNGIQHRTDESVAAHTNLVREIVDRYFSMAETPSYAGIFLTGGYSVRHYQTAIALHDITENIVGDIPDDGHRNEAAKLNFERQYWKNMISQLPGTYRIFGQEVLRLLEEMTTQSSMAGRILYSADKIAAILDCLTQDSLQGTVKYLISPRMRIDAYNIKPHTKQEMLICERKVNGYCLASEMWTIDYLKLRRRIRFDDSGFFTSILIMYTLMVNKTWYGWRERDYLENGL